MKAKVHLKRHALRKPKPVFHPIRSKGCRDRRFFELRGKTFQGVLCGHAAGATGLECVSSEGQTYEEPDGEDELIDI
eukprot:3037372-Amphidinium_carterae.1